MTLNQDFSPICLSCCWLIVYLLRVLHPTYYLACCFGMPEEQHSDSFCEHFNFRDVGSCAGSCSGQARAASAHLLLFPWKKLAWSSRHRHLSCPLAMEPEGQVIPHNLRMWGFLKTGSAAFPHALFWFVAYNFRQVFWSFLHYLRDQGMGWHFSQLLWTSASF